MNNACPWSDEETARLKKMLSAGCSPRRIAALLGFLPSRVRDKIKNLRRTGVRVRVVLPQPQDYDRPGPVSEPERPIKDNLAACEERWAALFGGRRTLAYARPETRVAVERARDQVGKFGEAA